MRLQTQSCYPAIALQSFATALLAEQRADRPKLRLIDRRQDAFALGDRPSPLLSPTTFWVLSPPRITLKPPPQRASSPDADNLCNLTDSFRRSGAATG